MLNEVPSVAVLTPQWLPPSPRSLLATFVVRHLQIEIERPALGIEVGDLGRGVFLGRPAASVPDALHESAARR